MRYSCQSPDVASGVINILIRTVKAGQAITDDDYNKAYEIFYAICQCETMAWKQFNLTGGIK